MSGMELNKLAAAILLAGLIAMIAGTISKAIYGSEESSKAAERGYVVAVEKEKILTAVEEKIDIAALLATADVARGKKVSKKCVSCHTFEKDGDHKVGPKLWNTIGNKIARHDDYNYSKAFQTLDGEWDYEKIFAYLKNPKKFIKGTKMAFVGLRKPEDIAAIVAYMRESSDNPPPLPDVTVEASGETVESIENIVEKLEEGESVDITIESPGGKEETISIEIPEESSEENLPENDVEGNVDAPFDTMMVIRAGTITNEQEKPPALVPHENTEEDTTVFELDGSPDIDQPIP